MLIRLPLLHRVFSVSIVALLFLPSALRAAEKNEDYRAAIESITGEGLIARDSVLAGEKCEGREAGTQGSAEARKYIIEQFTKYKLQPAGEPGKFEQPFSPNYFNILGVIPGRDPELKNEYVLVCAHYDHVGLGAGRSLDGNGSIHPGADDNASGTSALMQLAEAFSHLAEPPKRSVMLVAWDAEEKGLLGSKYWAAHPTVPTERVVAALNLDMIGRTRANTLYIFGMRTGAGWRRLLAESNREPGLNLEFSWHLAPNADHYPLFIVGIPALLFHTGVHDDYHRTTDTPEKLNAQGMSGIVRLAFGVLDELAERPERIACRTIAKDENEETEKRILQDSPAPQPRLGVAFYPESNEENRPAGVRLGKIAPDSSAFKAGIKENDRVLSFADREVQKNEELIGAVMSSESPAKAVVQSPNDEKPREIQVELPGRPLRWGITWRVDEAEPGTLILTHVIPGTPAAYAGLQPGDRIDQIAGHDFADEAEFLHGVQATPDALDVLIERNGQLQLKQLRLKPAEA